MMGCNTVNKEQSLLQIDARKEKIRLMVDKSEVLNGQKARVGLVLDFSGSAKPDYESGTIQAMIERLYPLAAVFDDNAELDLWIFWDGETGFRRIGTVTKDNFYGIVNQIMAKYSFGGTNYTPVMQDVKKMYIDENPAQIANYVIFMTDGQCWDRTVAESTVKDYSKYPIFWQFVGFSDRERDFGFLEKLDNMPGRYVDNANFFHVKDIDAMTDDDLYKKLLDEFPQWLADAKVQQMISDQGNTAAGKKKKGKLFGLFG